MNRFGINLWNWIKNLNEDILPLIGHAAGMGFTAIELPMTQPDVPNIKALKQELERYSMEVSLCLLMTAERDMSSFDEKVRKQAKSYLLKCFETAEYLGARVVAGPMYSGGGKRHRLKEEDRKREWDLAVSGLREMAEAARLHGLSLAIEPLHRYRTSVVNTAEQALQMVQDIGCDNVGVHFDTYHANIEEFDPLSALESVLKANKLEHFHACGNNRGAPGTGHIPWDRVFDLLKKYKYQHHITMETFCEGSLDECFYPLAASQDELAATGIRYLKSVYSDE